MLWFWCRPDILHGTLCYIFGILQCLPGCRQIQLRGVAFIVITRQHFNFNYSKNSPYPSKVQVNVVYVWGSKQNQCLLYFQKHDSRLLLHLKGNTAIMLLSKWRHLHWLRRYMYRLKEYPSTNKNDTQVTSNTCSCWTEIVR